MIAGRKRWTKANAAVDCLEKQVEVADRERLMRIGIYRRRKRHGVPKNFPLDLFDPADGHEEYSAVVTNKDLTGAYPRYLECGRGSREKAYAELENGFALDPLASRRHAANGALQMPSRLSFDLIPSIHVASGASKRSPNKSRSVIYRLASIQTPRYRLIGRAGIGVRPGGHTTLDVESAPKVAIVF